VIEVIRFRYVYRLKVQWFLSGVVNPNTKSIKWLFTQIWHKLAVFKGYEALFAKVLWLNQGEKYISTP